MNLRPSGYEPDELPDCSTPHQELRMILDDFRIGKGSNRSFPGIRSAARAQLAAEVITVDKTG